MEGPSTGATAGSSAAVGGQRRTRSALSRKRVLATALLLVDADGVDSFSMRRLGKALSCDPMQLYRYAPSKDALLDGVVELVLSHLDVPSAADGDWAHVLRRTGHAFRELALAHPNVVPLLVTRPLATPLALRPLGTLRPPGEAARSVHHRRFR